MNCGEQRQLRSIIGSPAAMTRLGNERRYRKKQFSTDVPRSAQQSLRRSIVVVRLLALLVGFADDLRQTAGVARGTNRRAAVDSGRADRLQYARLPRPGFGLLPWAARPKFLGDAVALALGPAGADDNLIPGRSRARVVPIDD